MSKRLIRFNEVMYLTSLSRPTIYRYMKDGIFPQRITLGGGTVVWKESDIHDWMAALVADRDRSVNQENNATKLRLIDWE
ncbi:helix-turn-helix transcriptional regulator [Vibrio sp. RC27]